MSSDAQRDTNAQNVALGREQMQFQERMSSTAYQRAVADMQSAGLNPMLAYSQGGASSPVGSMPQVQNATATGVASALQGMQVMQGFQQIAQSEAQADNLKASAAKMRSETLENKLHTARMVAETGLVEDTRHVRDEEFYTEQARGSKMRADADEARSAVTARRAAGAHEWEAKRTRAEEARARAAAELERLAIPEAAGSAKFYEDTKDMPKWIRLIIDSVKGGASARQLIRR